MARILVISDTHYPNRLIPDAFYGLIEDCDLLVHCGDFQDSDFYDELLLLGKPLHAVLGNNDDFLLERQLPRRLAFTAGGVRIGVVHGSGPSRKALENARREFAGEGLDIVLFGHSHVPTIQQEGGRLYLNPGSLTCSRSGGESYGILEVKDGGCQASIRRLEEDVVQGGTP